MNNLKLDSKIDYEALEKQRTELLQAQLKFELKSREVGKTLSLRRAVLRLVVDAKYKDAGEMIDSYIQSKKDFPSVENRARPYVVHAKELINAIRAKRNFPNLSQLSMSKQQEILDSAVAHFDELKFAIRYIEHAVKDEAIRDLRSTTWVLKTSVFTVLGVVLTAFMMDFNKSVGKPFWVVFNDFVDKGFDFFIATIPFL